MATEAAELAEEAVTLAMAEARAKLLTLMGPVPRAAVDTAAAAEDCTTHDVSRQAVRHMAWENAAFCATGADQWGSFLLTAGVTPILAVGKGIVAGSSSSSAL